MKLEGFIGPAYTLDSVNVDCQRCVNLYPEVIESGRGKGGQVAYLRATHGLKKILEVGDGPIRLIHVDSIGRIFVVSGNRLFAITRNDDGSWSETLVGADGIAGGDPVLFATSTGPVKAVSMSFQGDGTDSSTIFVDGVNNYLYKDDSPSDTFGILGEIDVAEAVFASANNFTVWTSQSINTWIGVPLKILAFQESFIDDRIVVEITAFAVGEVFSSLFFTIKTNDGSYGGPAVSLTTAELAQLINFGSVPGKNIQVLDFTGKFSIFSADGGDSTDVLTEFGTPGHTENFSQNTYSGEAFGSVPTATDITWIDGFFIVNEGGTNKFWVSDVASFNIDTLSFTSSEGDPDKVLALKDNHRDLWVFNETTTEIYANTGNADFPFERVQGGFLEVGCLAKYSVAKIDGTILWLGRTKDGQGQVYAASGMRHQRISTHPIEQAIAGYSNPENATAFAYEWKGHKFYVLNFDEATWVYDLSTGLWHERAFTVSGTLQRHRAETHAFVSAHGVHLVGDFQNNFVYMFDDETYTDAGMEITRLRSTPHTCDENLQRVFYLRFQLDMETGIGLDGGGLGSQPKVMLDWSDDGGHTWSSERWALADASSGQIGEYKTRVIWRRLGSSRDRVFRVKITDPVKVRLIGAYVDVERGTS